MEKAMGQLPDRTNLPDLDVQVTDSVKEETLHQVYDKF